ncbi:MAG: hypothetical protein Q8K99_06930 [Actinomycetota bacterium]|nr:hypothetical protein [Actinomycetota bacterium]
MTSNNTSADRGSRGAAIVVAVVYVLLAGLLLIDVARAGTPRIYPPRKRAQTLLEIAEQSGRVRAINPVIAIAAREVGRPDVYLEIPEDYADLLAITPDNFDGKPTSTLNSGLMAPFIGGRVRKVPYDPVLSQAKTARLEADPTAITLPRDVWAVAGADDAAVVRLYVDTTRTRVYIAPIGLAEEGAE